MRPSKTGKPLQQMIRRLGVLLVSMLVATHLVPAQEPSPERGGTDSPGELREEMKKFFENRLRSELALSDEQTAEILPRVGQLEDARGAARRARMDTVRELRRGLEHGATDTELQQLLDGLERIEREQRELERSLLSEIDQVLSTRQRVQLRFFMEEFRKAVARKIQELRGDPVRRRDPMRRRGPRRDMP